MSLKVLVPQCLILLFALVVVCSCTHAPPVKLNNPLCFRIQNNINLQAATMFGIRNWSRQLPNLPPPIFQLPDSSCKGNPPIDVFLDSTLENAAGQANSYYWGYTIRIHPNHIHSMVLSHEIGHIIWKMEHVKGRFSIMAAFGFNEILPADIEMIYQRHPELSR